MDNNQASSIRGREHLNVFAKVASERFKNIDISPVLVYLVDTVPVQILPFLAKQLDVAGIKGLGLADTEQQQRDIIKRSIELHRYKGTPFAVKEAIKSLGFVNVEIEEGVTVPNQTYNGSINYDGGNAFAFVGSSPFNFRIVIDTDDVPRMTSAIRSNMVRLINQYKNTRSWLVAITYREAVRPSYNARFNYNGDINYDQEVYLVNTNI